LLLAAWSENSRVKIKKLLQEVVTKLIVMLGLEQIFKHPTKKNYCLAKTKTKVNFVKCGCKQG